MKQSKQRLAKALNALPKIGLSLESEETQTWESYSADLQQMAIKKAQDLPWVDINTTDILTSGNEEVFWRGHGAFDPYQGQGEDWAHASPTKPVYFGASSNGMGYKGILPEIGFLTSFESVLGDSHPAGGDFGLEQVLSDKSYAREFKRLKDFGTTPSDIAFEVPVSRDISPVKSRYATRTGANGTIQVCELYASEQGVQFLSLCEQLNNEAIQWQEKTSMHPHKGNAYYSAHASEHARDGVRHGTMKQLCALADVISGGSDPLLVANMDETVIEWAKKHWVKKITKCLQDVPSDLMHGGSIESRAIAVLPDVALMLDKSCLADKINLSFNDEESELFAKELCHLSKEQIEIFSKIDALREPIRNRQEELKIYRIEGIVEQLDSIPGVGNFFVNSGTPGAHTREVTSKEFAEEINEQKVSPNHLIWRHELTANWVALSQVPELKKIVRDHIEPKETSVGMSRSDGFSFVSSDTLPSTIPSSISGEQKIISTGIVQQSETILFAEKIQLGGLNGLNLNTYRANRVDGAPVSRATSRASRAGR